MAEAFARKLAAERGLRDITFSSAGTSAFEGNPASDAAVLVGLERGVDLSLHRSRALDALTLDNDTIALALSESHLRTIRAIAPHVRAYLLHDFATRGEGRRSVRDPFGGDLEEYRAAADDIEAMLAGVIDRLLAEQQSRAH